MVYVLKDEKGNYVGDNSISYNQETKENTYSYSERLVNGFYTFPTEEKAKEGLKTLKMLATKIGFDMNFYIQRINMPDIITYESKLGIKNNPIVHEVMFVRQHSFA